MGPRNSKQSLSVSSDLVTNATLNQSQDCIVADFAENVINVQGSGNVVSGAKQGITFTVKQDCASTLDAKENFQASVNDQIAQSLKNQTTALMSWASPGSAKESINLSNSVTTNITTTMVQKCLATLQGRNVINIQGSGNVLENTKQDVSMKVLSSCMQGNTQALSTMTDITDTINQKQSNVDENPFGFITDAITAVVGDLAVAAVVVVVLVVLVVAIAGALGGSKKSPAPLPPSMAMVT